MTVIVSVIVETSYEVYCVVQSPQVYVASWPLSEQVEVHSVVVSVV